MDLQAGSVQSSALDFSSQQVASLHSTSLHGKTNLVAKSSSWISSFYYHNSTSNIVVPSSTKHDINPYTSTAFWPSSSHVINATTTTTAQPVTLTPETASKQRNLVYYVGIPVGVIGLFILTLILIKVWKWYQRKKMLKKEFAPCYTYDQTENEVIDGVLFPSGTNSVDLLHVDASSPPVSRSVEDDEEDDDETHLLNDKQQELDDFAADTQRCESIAV